MIDSTQLQVGVPVTGEQLRKAPEYHQVHLWKVKKAGMKKHFNFMGMPDAKPGDEYTLLRRVNQQMDASILRQDAPGPKELAILSKLL